jgi:hypothetical protein
LIGEKMKMKARKSPLVLLSLLFLLGAAACSVDLDDFVYDDELLEEAQGDGDGDGDTGGSNGDGDGDGDGDGSGGRVALSECELFCADSAVVCPFGGEDGYASVLECVTLCGGYSEGELSCRVEHIGLAETNPVTHCPHTLEDGGGVCPDARPTECELFCADSAVACPFGGANGYASESECLNLCDGYSEAEMSCRVEHIGLAETNPITHCPHTLEDGGGVCPDATR